MSELSSLSQDLLKALDLPYEAVGVRLYGKDDPLPVGIPFSDKSFKSYCQALVLAGRGEPLLLKREQMGCKLGTSVLGFEEEMDRYLDDGILEKYGVGLFENEEASAETILKATYLEKGKTQAVLISPLSTLSETPDVVIFTADSEQIMWLLYAVNYKTGGRMDLPQSGGALGGCSDITVLPILNGTPNVTFLGLGCRIKSAIDSCHLMMGIPGSGIKAVRDHILALGKPIAMLGVSKKR